VTDKYTKDDSEMIITSAGPWFHAIFDSPYIHLDHVICLMNQAYKEGREDGIEYALNNIPDSII